MISVVVYGRNDSYGYNLAKRAAMSINCIAQLLDDPSDEIIFVDCNTPNDIPTFPESIADTLTQRAKNLLRVIRVRPDQYERGKNGAKFKVLEPLCRNIAIRRSNPVNRWILNTNTDMVFTPHVVGRSLSSVAAALPDGFYELPRFEMPESLWETCDRSKPEEIILNFRQWGQQFHINEIITAGKEILFDGPGDFQLCLRSQLIEIHGMNEQMVRGWHVDSNLCKRMWLLNGETLTLLDQLYAYHCDHTRIQTVYHAAGVASENSLDDFFVNLQLPYIPEQAACWGMPDEQFEEIRLTGLYPVRLANALATVLPGMMRPLTGRSVVGRCEYSSHYYDNSHAFTYIADILIHLPKRGTVGYVGSNAELLAMQKAFLSSLGHEGLLIYCEELLPADTVQCAADNSKPVSLATVLECSSTLIFDLSLKHLEYVQNSDGFPVPVRNEGMKNFIVTMKAAIDQFREHEERVRQNATKLPTYCIFVGCHGTWFDEYIMQLFDCCITPTSSCIRNGFLKTDSHQRSPLLLVHQYVIGVQYLEEKQVWVGNRIGRSVMREELELAIECYDQFIRAENSLAAEQSLAMLLKSDVGFGLLQMEIAICEINGLTNAAEGLKRLLAQVSKR